ncbi:hypothetical protein IP91_00106 [Pseudoduganella lurida]|uniref:Uncharacterized protein n=1 Tax=Pseudoduganella lurida TaxID=1036180 RepID=A0A562RJ25_9BURK|nr:hypothetical protein [Pseudoduganella lurida]TWI69041.1 hypothetical protein IP91_00106 [Pseudoduganella lurida]
MNEQHPIDDIVQGVAELAHSVGLEVYGLVDTPGFVSVPMVFGPLDSIAILADLLLERIEPTPRRYRGRRVGATACRIQRTAKHDGDSIVVPAGTAPLTDDVLVIGLPLREGDSQERITPGTAPGTTTTRRTTP